MSLTGVKMTKLMSKHVTMFCDPLTGQLNGLVLYSYLLVLFSFIN